MVRYASRAVELEPGDGAHWSQLGYAFWQAGDAANAGRSLLRAREFQSGHPQPAAILGDISSGRNDHAAAAQHCREALRREPGLVEL